MFWLLAVTNLISAALVFTVQPMISKLALPLFGGSAMVWNTALMVFQGGLLAGYVYALALGRLSSITAQIAVHAALVLISMTLLPIAFEMVGISDNPSLALTASLLTSIGLPYVVVCTTSPLTQRWYFEWSDGSGRDTYQLYSLSNIGSLLALLIYPFVIEPRFDSDVQRWTWSAAYLVLALGLLFFMLRWHRTQRLRSQAVAQRATVLTRTECARWVLYAFVPSLYLMGVTLHVGTDIAAAPFTWVLPLALYLLSFILLFARPAWGTHPALLTAQACVLIALGIYFFYSNLAFLLALHLAGLFLTCMVCHGRLVAERPPAARLSEFYVWMALGGWLGGIVGSLVAPTYFHDNWEYIIAIAGACLLRPTQTSGSRYVDWLAPLALAGSLGVILWLNLPTALRSYVVFGLFVVCAYAFRPRRVRFALTVVPLVVSNQLLDADRAIIRERSFYGIYEVGLDPGGSLKQLTHGTTLHGAQAVDTAFQVLPLTYYNPEGPLGQVMAAQRDAGTLHNVGVVGLGVGAIACYALPHTKLTFYEIDPLVERLARSEFSYLSRCAPSAKIIIGDGRLSLQEDSDARYDLLIVDAFSSDAIPLHLLTAEAMALYRSRLTAEGALIYHVSNRYVDLSGVLARLAEDRGDTAYAQAYAPSLDEQQRGATASDWVLIVDSSATPPRGGKWHRLYAEEGDQRWTDLRTDLLSVIAWDKVFGF